MTTTFIKNNLIDQISRLPYDLQLRVFDFVKTLIPKGIEGKSLLRFEGAISADDLHLMSKAISEERPSRSKILFIKIILIIFSVVKSYIILFNNHIF